MTAAQERREEMRPIIFFHICMVVYICCQPRGPYMIRRPCQSCSRSVVVPLSLA
jgi:hypothetical protein